MKKNPNQNPRSITVTVDRDLMQIVFDMITPVAKKFLEGNATGLELEKLVSLYKRVERILEP